MIDWKLFNDTFEAEINAQEFEIDEAEWAGLLKALKKAEETVSEHNAADSGATTDTASLPSNGSGSQDSVDKLIDDFAYELYEACTTRTEQGFDDEEERLKAIYRKAFLAWHNTQLKAVLQSLLPQMTPDEYSLWVRTRIVDLLTNLEA